MTSAPYVSDYSRYLPSDTPRFRIIRHVFAGAALSAIWLIALGAWLATRLGSEDGLLALARAGDLVQPHLGACWRRLDHRAHRHGGHECVQLDAHVHHHGRLGTLVAPYPTAAGRGHPGDHCAVGGPGIVIRQYGAIDMIVTPQGEHVFLELNPNGQFGWIQERTGLPLYEAMADLLISGKEER